MHSDCATITGKSHKICQDYARAKGNSVIVADGCSGSPDSDFGARLLVKVAENNIDVPPETLALLALKKAVDLQLAEECIDATFMSAKVEAGGKVVTTKVFGDGVIALKLKNGTIVSKMISFPSGYPQYLSYATSAERRKLLKETAGDNKKTIHSLCILSNGEITEEGLSEDTNGGVVFELPLIDDNPEFNVEFVAIMTDGVCSFVHKTDSGTIEPIIYTEVLKRIMDIKVPKGDFAQRQMNGFVKEFTKLGWYNVDDFTVGMIYAKD